MKFHRGIIKTIGEHGLTEPAIHQYLLIVQENVVFKVTENKSIKYI